VLPAVLAALLFHPLIFAGFSEAKDFTLAFTARLLADVGLSRLDVAGLLGGPELNYALALTPPITLATHTLLFRALGDSPAAQNAATLALHLLVMFAAMWAAWEWRREPAASLVAGVVVATHPIAAGIVGGIGQLGAVLATLFVLLAVAFSIRFARDGNRLLLGPLMLTGVFAAAADAVGLVAIPAALSAALAAPEPRHVSRARSLAAPAAVVLGALTPLLFILTLHGPRIYAAQLLGPGLRRLGDCAAWAMHALALPAGFALDNRREWLGRLLIAALIAALLTLTAPRARRRPALIVWPALTLLALWPGALGLGPVGPAADAGVFAACYLPLAFIALWVAELTPARRLRRVAFIALLFAVLVPQTRALVTARAGRAQLINRLGREMGFFIDRARMGADVLLSARPSQVRLMETAFLAGQYRTEAPRQIRYRLVMGGRLLAAPRATPLGENNSGFARLPFTDENMVLALSPDGAHVADLSGQIRAKMKLAEDVIREEGHAPPVWPLLDEAALNQWDVGQNCRGLQSLSPDDFAWFLEGYYYRLHPHLGQVSF